MSTIDAGPVVAESSDQYDRIVTQLNDRWRVIECRHGLQWILQHRGSPEKPRRDDWRGRSFCRTSEALRRCAREFCGSVDPAAVAVLESLPARIDHLVAVVPDKVGALC
jgi:hypothetical protein